MRYALPRYEMRVDDNDTWQEISDIELMEELYKHYDRVTPIIKEMMSGKELQLANAVYRLKWKGGDSEVSRSLQKSENAKTGR